MAALRGVKTVGMEDGDTTKVTYEGAEYAVAIGDAKAGDLALRTRYDKHYFTVGCFYQVINGRYDGSSIIDDDGDTNRYFDDRYALFRKVEQPLKVGDRAKIINAWGALAGFVSGDVVELHANDFRGSDFEVRKGALVGFTDASNLTKMTDVKPKLVEQSLKVGDYAKVVHGPGYVLFHYSVGDITKITRLRDDGYVYVKSEGGREEHMHPSQVVKLSDEEAAEAKLDAEWATIGRKPNEFKKGDIVRVTDDYYLSSARKPGDIDEINDIDVDKWVHVGKPVNGVGAWVPPAYIELITPVEQRFDQ